MLIDPEAFEVGFATWVGALTTGFEREVVAIDGKTIRRSFDHGREQCRVGPGSLTPSRSQIRT